MKIVIVLELCIRKSLASYKCFVFEKPIRIPFIPLGSSFLMLFPLFLK